MTYRTPDPAASADALRATTPYRTAPVATPRPLAWLARALPRTEWALSTARGWRWYRRAIGGAWELRCYWLMPGAMEEWYPREHAQRLTYAVVGSEVWP